MTSKSGRSPGSSLNGLPEDHVFELTASDLHDVEAFRERAKAVGCDRLAVHPAIAMEDGRTTGYVSAHREGERWSTWAFGRSGSNILAWNALDGNDMGTYGTMLEALEQVLLGPGTKLPVIDGEDR